MAGECIVNAETKDHLNWELIGEIVKNGSGEDLEVMKAAHDEVEDEEDEHLYHTMGWTRELWMKSLGLRAVIPPPEEKWDVKTMVGAAQAKESRESGSGRPARAPGRKKSPSRKSQRKKASAGR